ncbi:MAG: ribonuclease E activity regulator RraA [Chloroflexi bacterium]|nr:ribonuclease E activity regulator RraA [Chloroflexota bacterium]
MKTTDICDASDGEVQVAAPLLRDFGGVQAFAGPIATVRVFEDNVLVRGALSEPGDGRILVIDGGGSLRCALVGDMLAMLGQQNGWAGIIVNGCVRDTAELATIPIGIKALAPCPRRSAKRGTGSRDEPVHFAGILFVPGHRVYADADGIVVTKP